ncbi:hypothetical protein D0C36_01905 [Mucilaginibacter conchicola]|uniref:Uncharacterized protein n=2 Tax=Mucilaginibacter conchicola TaxID=2303333 RepID=A0A372NW59_9SPHI|nr:hypothetical protein D0C36_01905 [Mucilaginibacter conchicola]
MIFILQIKNKIKDRQVVNFLVSQFSLTQKDIGELMSGKTDTKINYQIFCRECPSEFKVELTFFIKEEVCLELEIFNSLIIALSFVDYFSRAVVINDESQDPYRWILVNEFKKIFVTDEVIYDDNGLFNEGLFIDYSTAKEITINSAMKVLPDRDYYLTKATDRPVFYNQDPTWG